MNPPLRSIAATAVDGLEAIETAVHSSNLAGEKQKMVSISPPPPVERSLSVGVFERVGIPFGTRLAHPGSSLAGSSYEHTCGDEHAKGGSLTYAKKSKHYYFYRKCWEALSRRVGALVGHVQVTPALRAAQLQRTPCGVNRYVLLGLYFLYAFLTARVYFAWPSLSNLLFRSDAYAWMCDANSPDLRLADNGGRRYRCEAQNSQVGTLFVTCLTFAFSCSLLAGLLLDFFGPKITALVGQLCNMLSWLFLAFAGKDAQTYFPAFIFMGIGSDVGYLPVLSSANLFPGHEGLVVACLGAAKSLSFAVPAILDAVELRNSHITIKEVSLGYATFGPGFCLLLALLLIPLQSFIPWNEFEFLEDPSVPAPRPLVRVNDSFASYGAHAWRDSFSSFQDVKEWMHHRNIVTPLEELTFNVPDNGSFFHGPAAGGAVDGINSGTVKPLYGVHTPGSTAASRIPPLSLPASCGGQVASLSTSSKVAPVVNVPESALLRHYSSATRSRDFGSASFSTAAAYTSQQGERSETVPIVGSDVITGTATNVADMAEEDDITRAQTAEAAETVHKLQQGDVAAISTAEAPISEGGGEQSDQVVVSVPETPTASLEGFIVKPDGKSTPIAPLADNADPTTAPKEVLENGEAAKDGESTAAAAPAEQDETQRLQGQQPEGDSRKASSVGFGQRRPLAAAGGSSGGGDFRRTSIDANAEEPVPSFQKQFFSKYSFGIVFYSVLKAIMYAFFTTGGENLLGKQVNDFMGAALPFSCIPCIMLGKVVDMVGIMPVLLMLNSCITLAYGFSMIPSLATAYMGALLYICYVSFYSSQSYCYVSDTFSSCHFGKLVGIIHMIAGLLSLLKIPMQSLVVHAFNSNYLYPCVIMLVFCGANFGILIWLVILKRKNPHPFWPQNLADANRENTKQTVQGKEKEGKVKKLEALEKKDQPRHDAASVAEDDGNIFGKQHGSSLQKDSSSTAYRIAVEKGFTQENPGKFEEEQPRNTSVLHSADAPTV